VQYNKSYICFYQVESFYTTNVRMKLLEDIKIRVRDCVINNTQISLHNIVFYTFTTAGFRIVTYYSLQNYNTFRPESKMV